MKGKTMDTMEQTTTKTRFFNALKEVRRHGVKVRQNVKVCCNGCMTADMLGLTDEDQMYAYTFGGQGQAYKWSDDNETPMVTPDFGRRYSKPLDSILLYWGNGSAPLLVKALEDNDFDVEWDGSDHQCVKVNL